MSEVRGWEHSDAWVLAAIMIGRNTEGLATLRDVIAAGDFINHAILLDSEVEQAVRRLLGRELIAVSAEGFRLTPAGEALTPSGRVQVMKQVDRLLAHLEREPVRERDWHLDAETMRRAIDAYLRSP